MCDENVMNLSCFVGRFNKELLFNYNRRIFISVKNMLNAQKVIIKVYNGIEGFRFVVRQIVIYDSLNPVIRPDWVFSS